MELKIDLGNLKNLYLDQIVLVFRLLFFLPSAQKDKNKIRLPYLTDTGKESLSGGQ